MDAPPPDPPAEHASLRDHVQSNCPVSRVEVVDVGIPVDIPANAQLRWSGSVCHPNPTIRVQALVDGDLVGSWTARPRLRLWAMTSVAPHDAPANTPFETVRGEAPWSAAKAGALYGRVQSRVPLRAGEAVSPRTARKLPDAANGAAVNILIEYGTVRVSAPGTLVGPGSIGRTVHVRNGVTGRLHRGVMRSNTTVILSP